MKHFLTFVSALALAASVSAQTAVYRNPIIDKNSPDPTILRADDGSFYLYATENTRNVPIYHSTDLVNWNLLGTAFTDETRPKWNAKGMIWAPDINKIGDKYVLYYAKSVWGGEWEAGVGVAVANSPQGPFTDCGNIIDSRKIGIQNCIDPFYIEDGGRRYLFWGSFHGIYGAELTADGLSLKPDSKPRKVAGSFMEGAYIQRRGGYYYLFGSAGTCCEGAKSTYRVTVGRSKKLFGPYVDKKGQLLLDNHYEVVLQRNERVAGPGHNAEIVTDDAGTDFLIYHGFKTDKPRDGRVVYMDRIDWVDSWPYIQGGTPSVVAAAPVIKPTWKLTKSGLNPSNFEANIRGKQTHLYTLTNKNGVEMCMTNLGGRIVSLMVPDRQGKFHDVCLGYDNVAQYADYEHFGSDFGATIGRYANRINQGRITIDGETIQLPQNNYGHCLHGGFTGWQYQVFDCKQTAPNTLEFTLLSPHNDNNFPGNVKTVVTYTLTDDNAIDIQYTATTDRKTVINMTNHAYWNLNGEPTRDAEDHHLYINADNFTPVDTTYMTDGTIVSVKGTPMDFRKMHALSQDINSQTYAPIKAARGFDFNWCLNTYKNGKGNDKKLAAALYSPKTGILMDIYTDEPGIQCYTGNFLDGSNTCKHGDRYPKHASICLETQHYPDSPNKPQWPSAYLSPGETYRSHCVYKFSVKK